MSELHHEIGRHDAQIEALEREVHALRGDVADIKRMLSEARGGWKVMMMVAGFSATIGAGVAKILTWAGVLPK